MTRTKAGALCAAVALAGGVFAASAISAPNPDSAAGVCGPPGQIISEFTPNPPSQFGIAPGQLVRIFCAPGQRIV